MATLATTDKKIRFLEVSPTSNIISNNEITDATSAGIVTSDIVFIPTLHSIYHNGEYYGFTQAERELIDGNTTAILNLINDKINFLSVNSGQKPINGSTINVTYATTSSGNGKIVKTAYVTLTGTTLPIDVKGGTSIKSYIDDKIEDVESKSGVPAIIKSGFIDENGTKTGTVTINAAATNHILGATYNDASIYATTLNGDGQVATAIETLDKEILRKYNELNGSIGTLQGIVHTINSGVTDSLTATSHTFTHNASSTINLNSTNIVVGGNALSASGMTTINVGSSIHDALSNVYDRLNNLSNVDNGTLTALKQLEYELNYGTGDGFATSFLDKVGWLINGFDGVNVATAASTNAKDVSLKNAVASMINSATASAPYINSIAFTSNISDTTNQLGKTITADASNHTGTVNITGNKVVIGSDISTSHTTTVIASTDSIATAFGKIKQEINSVTKPSLKQITLKNTGDSTEIFTFDANNSISAVVATSIKAEEVLKTSKAITATLSGNIAKNDSFETIAKKLLGKIEYAQGTADTALNRKEIKTITIVSNTTSAATLSGSATTAEDTVTLNVKGTDLILGATATGTAISTIEYTTTMSAAIQTIVENLSIASANIKDTKDQLVWYII